MVPVAADSIEGGARRAIELLGPDVVAMVAGVRPSTPYSWGNPHDTGNPTLPKAVAVDAHCLRRHGEAPFLNAYRSVLRRLVGDTGEKHLETLEREAIDVGVAAGEMLAAVRAALNPDGPGGRKVTSQELLTIKRAAMELVREVDEALAAAHRDAGACRGCDDR